MDSSGDVARGRLVGGQETEEDILCNTIQPSKLRNWSRSQTYSNTNNPKYNRHKYISIASTQYQILATVQSNTLHTMPHSQPIHKASKNAIHIQLPSAKKWFQNPNSRCESFLLYTPCAVTLQYRSRMETTSYVPSSETRTVFVYSSDVSLFVSKTTERLPLPAFVLRV